MLLPKNASVKVNMCGNVGDDSFGPILKEYLGKEGAGIEFVNSVEKESTGVAVIVVEEALNGENRILINSGANGHLHPSEQQYREMFPADFAGSQFVILENETPNTLETIEWLSTNRPKVNICYNPSPFKSFTKEQYAKINVLIVNETEALMCADDMFSGDELASFQQEIQQNKVQGFTKLATRLASAINDEKLNLCVITLGSKGSLYATKTSTRFFPSNLISKEKVVDTTGAGDTFLGGIISQLSLGNSIDDAMVFASKASSLTVQAKGAAEAIPYYSDVTK